MYKKVSVNRKCVKNIARFGLVGLEDKDARDTIIS
jgi:hypothetical protein